jgi:pimeloyl-ACP methyl ester carboxylesterase
MSEAKNIYFIHGNSSSSTYWRSASTSEVLNTYNIVCIELPGHGNMPQSEDTTTDYTMKGMAASILQQIEKDENTPYILIGHSLGTNIIGELAPFLTNEQCKGILLTSPTITGKNLTPSDILIENPLVFPLYSETATNEALSAMIENLTIKLNDDVKALIINDYKRTDPLARTYLFQSIMQGDYIDEIRAIEQLNVPIGVIFGKSETVCNIHYFDKLKSMLSKNYPIIIENAGHYLQLDQPTILNTHYKEFAELCFQP